MSKPFNVYPVNANCSKLTDRYVGMDLAPPNACHDDVELTADDVLELIDALASEALLQWGRFDDPGRSRAVWADIIAAIRLERMVRKVSA